MEGYENKDQLLKRREDLLTRQNQIQEEIDEINDEIEFLEAFDKVEFLEGVENTLAELYHSEHWPEEFKDKYNHILSDIVEDAQQLAKKIRHERGQD